MRPWGWGQAREQEGEEELEDGASRGMTTEAQGKGGAADGGDGRDGHGAAEMPGGGGDLPGRARRGRGCQGKQGVRGAQGLSGCGREGLVA